MSVVGPIPLPEDEPAIQLLVAEQMMRSLQPAQAKALRPISTPSASVGGTYLKSCAGSVECCLALKLKYQRLKPVASLSAVSLAAGFQEEDFQCHEQRPSEMDHTGH